MEYLETREKWVCWVRELYCLPVPTVARRVKSASFGMYTKVSSPVILIAATVPLASVTLAIVYDKSVRSSTTVTYRVKDYSSIYFES